MVETSPDWLPPGFTQKVKYKNGRRIKYFLNSETGAKFYSKNEVLSCGTEDHDVLTPKNANGGDSKLPSNANSSDTPNNASDGHSMLPSNATSSDSLPRGWIMEEKARESGQRKGSTYKVYTQVSSGKKFYSRAAVNQYLSVDQANSPVVHNKSLHVVSEDQLSPEKTKNSVSVASSISGRNRNSTSYLTVAVERFPADDLPAGWIKEIKTRKRGDKIRKDPYYTDPNSGYTFLSKPDALRFLQTGDIHKCAIRPFKQVLEGSKSSESADVKSSEHKSQFPRGGKLKQDDEHVVSPEVENQKKTSGSPTGSSKSKRKRDLSLPARASKRLGSNETETLPNSSLSKRSLRSAARICSADEHVGVKAVENSDKATRLENTRHVKAVDSVIRTLPLTVGMFSEGEKKKQKVTRFENTSHVKAVDAAIRTPPLTEGKFSESEKKKQTRSGSTKSKRKSNSSLPTRASKRLARSHPETLPDSVSAAAGESDKSPLYSAEGSPDVSPSDIEKLIVSVEKTVATGKGILEDVKQINKAVGNQAVEEKEKEPAVVQPDGIRISQESQLYNDFGDDWSDPLDFALKTMRGDIPIDDNIAIPGLFQEKIQIQTPLFYNVKDCGSPRPSDGDRKQNGNGGEASLSSPQAAEGEKKGNSIFPNFSSFISLSGKLDPSKYKRP